MAIRMAQSLATLPLILALTEGLICSAGVCGCTVNGEGTMATPSVYMYYYYDHAIMTVVVSSIN